MTEILPIGPYAANLSRLAESLNQSVQRFVVLAANTERKPTADNMLSAGARAAELIRSVHSLRHVVAEIELRCNQNYGTLKDGSNADQKSDPPARARVRRI